MLSRSALLSSIILFVLILGLLVPQPAAVHAAGPIYVDQAATGANTGAGWTDAYTDLQAALGAAAAGDEIWVAAGTYKPTTGTDRNASFGLKEGVKVYGGFAGTETSLNQRNWNTNVTTLSGDIGAANDASDNSYHVVSSSYLIEITVLDGFTISGGNANGGGTCPSAGCGGGMLNDHSIDVLLLTNLHFSGNSADYGGGMYNYYSYPTMTNASFSGNSAGYGGGMYNQHSRLSLVSGSFNGNHADMDGGGISNLFSDTTLINISFSSNSAASGGGIYNSQSLPILVNASFSGNSATVGGGMYNNRSRPTLTNASFSGNSADFGGGMRNISFSVVTVNNSILWGDTGGEISNSGSSATAQSSIVQGGYDGAVSVDPQFVDADGADNIFGTADDDLRLQAVSPAIDTASSTYLPADTNDLDGDANTTETIPYDLNGNPRIAGAAVDMGAYEDQTNPTRWYVNDDAPGALHNGRTWMYAYTDLQAALGAAAAGDEIWVAAGTYKPTAGTDRAALFALKEGVKVYGGFAATETSLTQRGWVTNVTSLSGDIGAANDASDNSFRVIYGNGLTSAAVLDGFTITGGYAHDFPVSSGAGMFNDNSSPSLVNLIFSGNSALVDGGGMYNVNSSRPTLVNVSFIGNSANRGSGIYNDNSSPTLINVSFSGNVASGYGGGMYNYNSSSPTLINVSFSGNAAMAGGGIRNNLNCNPKIYNSILWGDSPDEVANLANSTADVQFSIVQGGYTGTGNLSVDPLFVDANGADNAFGTIDDNLRLQAGSPAKNVGSTALLPPDAADLDGDGNTTEPISLDLGGAQRVFGASVDMGAYERGRLYVNQAASGANTGASWKYAYTDLQSALGAAGAGEEIWVAAGTYRPTNSLDRNVTFGLKEGVKVYGGFAATETSLSQRDWAANVTILSGDLGAANDYSDNSYHVVTSLNLTAASVLDGFTISGGNADSGSGCPSPACGGGMHSDTSSPTLVNLTFNGNAAIWGGGMYNGDSSPTLVNASFSGNAATWGGGMYNTESSPRLINASFSGNFSSVGGGMYNSNSGPRLDNSILWGDTGGEIANVNSSTTVQSSIVQGGYSGALNFDPLFVDANGADNIFGTADDNLRLQAISPAIDEGDTALLPKDAADLDGDGDVDETLPFDLDVSPRVINTAVDLGAYEVQVIAQTISFDPLADKTIDDADFFLNATASSGLPVVYSASGPCQIVTPDIVHLTGGGTCTITASQPGSSVFDPATPVQRSFTVFSNNAPQVQPVGDRQVDEANLLAFTVQASDALDTPANTLSFALVNPPAGASINAQTGVFTWTPGEAQGPGSYPITVRVGDDGVPVRFSDVHFIVSVLAVNDLSLTIQPAATQALTGTTLNYQLTATNHDPDTGSSLVFTATLPAGLTFNSAGSDAGCSAQGAQVSCSAAQIAANGQASLILAADIGVGLADGTQLILEAYLSAAQSDSQLGNNSASASVPVYYQIDVYDQNEATPGSEWSAPITSITPSGEGFLGEFNNQEVTLTLTDLLSHGQAIVTFDLFILRSWDGNQVDQTQAMAQIIPDIAASSRVGPDLWEFEAQGGVRLHASYTNWPLFHQSYPADYPVGDYPARTGAYRQGDLGYAYYHVTGMDSVYRLRFVVNDSDSTLVLKFRDLGLQALSDEAWGLANVKVMLRGGSQELFRLLLPLTTYTK